jgi:hypothetical protein
MGHGEGNEVRREVGRTGIGKGRVFGRGVGRDAGTERVGRR